MAVVRRQGRDAVDAFIAATEALGIEARTMPDDDVGIDEQ